MRESFILGETSLYASASIGAAVIEDGSRDNAEAVRRADIALLQAKRDGRNKLQVFKAKKITDKRILESDLRHALSANRNNGLRFGKMRTAITTLDFT